ncbi:hypothetical protein Tco_1103406 [Tanacetum coccineum]
MHNNIMAAGSRDRPPMLATGRYAQWRSRFLRYIDTRPNGDALRKCILEGPYTLTTVVVPAVPATENSPAVPEQTTVETVMNMTPENRAHFESEKEAIHLILTGIGCNLVTPSGSFIFEVVASLLVELYLLLKEELDILWKLTLLFPDLRVMVPVSNLIMALAVVRNGVPKMKGLFSFSLISKITKSTGNTCGVGHNVHIEPLIDEGVYVLKVPYAARYFEIPSDVLLLCYLFLKNRVINRSPRCSEIMFGGLSHSFWPWAKFSMASHASSPLNSLKSPSAAKSRSIWV